MKKLSLNDLDNDISSLGIEDLVIFGALFFCCTGATICFSLPAPLLPLKVRGSAQHNKDLRQKSSIPKLLPIGICLGRI